MLAEDEEKFFDLITRPMSESEISEFQDVLESADMKVMIRAYHSEVALAATRGIILELFQSKNVPSTVILQAIMQLCLESMRELDSHFDDDLVNVWLDLLAVFCESWTQLVLDAMQNQALNLKTNPVPELEEMYKLWKSAMPPAQDLRQSQPRALEATEQVYQIFAQYQTQLQAQSDIALEDADYLDMWMHMILQVYIFTYLENGELYYLFSNNTSLITAQISTFVTLLQAVEGYEDLLLPENKDKLMNLLQPSN